jgi:hypothetical protein
VIDGFVLIQIRKWDLAQPLERFFDERFPGLVGVIGVVIEQMVVAFDTVVDRIGGMQLEKPFEVVSAEFGEFGHAGEISPLSPRRNFLAIEDNFTAIFCQGSFWQ